MHPFHQFTFSMLIHVSMTHALGKLSSNVHQTSACTYQILKGKDKYIFINIAHIYLVSRLYKYIHHNNVTLASSIYIYDEMETKEN